MSGSRWKHHQSSSQTRKRINLAVTALLVIIALILLGKFVGFIRTMTMPISGKEVLTSAKNYQWDGQSTINLVVKTDTVYALSYNPVDQEMTILKVPDDTYLDVPRDFGRWPTRSIYGLGESEKNVTGAWLLKQTLQSTLGVPIDGYLALGDSSPTAGSGAAKPLDQSIEQIRKNPFATMAFMRHSSTDLSTWEYMELLWHWWGVRADKLKVVDLGQSQITQSVLLPDGSRALGIDRVRLDQLIQSQFQDQRLSYEGLNIGLYNATDHPGLAERASRIITNMGGRVVFTANSPQLIPTSVTYGKDSYTKKRLTEVFANQCVKKKCAVPTGDIETTRADVILFLGEDDAQRL